MKPKIYLFKGVSNQFESPIESWCIPAGGEWIVEPKECDECSNYSCHPYENLIQGFSDFEEVDPSKKGFIGSYWPLISLPNIIEKIKSALVDVEVTRVGYSEWNQEEVLEGEARFEKEPILKCIFPTKPFNYFIDLNNKPCKQCKKCGSNIDLKWKSKKGNQFIFPDFTKWSGENIFFVPYFRYSSEGVIITEDGVNALKAIEVTNLDLEEIEWA